MKVLICDDDPVVHESLGIYLKNEGFDFLSAYDGSEGLALINSEKPDMVVLDIMMPKMNGLDLCRVVRKDNPVPILMLTAKGEEIDRILGLELGADDYIVKPFSPREIVARIKAITRRISEMPVKAGDDGLKVGNLVISMKKYQVTYQGQVIISTPKEVEILQLLAENPGQVFSREQILERVWGFDYYGDTRTVDTHIKKIRAKMPKDSETPVLHTVYGVGYKVEVI